MDEYYANGWDDYVDGVQENPYPFGTAAYSSWNSGWIAAQDDDAASSYIPEDDVYWSGTGELMSDDSYIDYLNSH